MTNRVNRYPQYQQLVEVPKMTLKKFSYEQKHHDTTETESETCSSSEASINSENDIRGDSAIALELGWASATHHHALHWPNYQMEGKVSDQSITKKRTTLPSKKLSEHVVVRKEHSSKSNSLSRKIATSLFLLGVLSLGMSFIFLSTYTAYESPEVYLPDEYHRLLYEAKERILAKVHVPRSSTSFVLVLNALHDRLDLIQNSIDSHSMCKRVKKIQIIWRLREDPPKSILNHKSGKVNLITLNSTKAPMEIITEGVLVLSDDLIFTCSELDRAFGVWNQNPSQMVGFFPYSHEVTTESRYVWRGSKHVLSNAPSGVPYSIVSDRAAFIHRAFLDGYHQWLLRDKVTPTFCQSLLLSLKVTSITDKAPLAMVAKPLFLQNSAVFVDRAQTEEARSLSDSGSCVLSYMREFGLTDLPEGRLFFVGGK